MRLLLRGLHGLGAAALVAVLLLRLWPGAPALRPGPWVAAALIVTVLAGLGLLMRRPALLGQRWLLVKLLLLMGLLGALAAGSGAVALGLALAAAALGVSHARLGQRRPDATLQRPPPG